MKRIHLALTALTLACLVAYFSLLDSSDRGDNRAADPIIKSTLQESPDLALLSSPSVDRKSESTGEPSLSTLDPQEPQRSVALENKAPATDGPIRIKVVEKESGQAVPNAEVLWLSIEMITDEDQAAFRADPSRLEGIFDQRGSLKKADAAGFLEIARPNSKVMMLGRSERLWSLQPLIFDESNFMLFELDNDPSVSARVTDTKGKPIAGVPVCLRVIEHGFATDLFHSKTDKNGLATLRHLNFIIQTSQDTPVYLAVAAPLGDPLEAKIDPEYLGDTVTLVLPEHGGLNIEARDSSGRMIEKEQILKIAWEVMSAKAPSIQRREQEAQEIILVEGQARVFPVSLGLMTRLSTRTLQGSESEPIRVMGPAAQGEWVRIEVAAVEPLTLKGRLVLPAGLEPEGLHVDLQSLWRIRPEQDNDDPKHRELDHKKTFRSSAGGLFEIDLPDFLRGKQINGAALSISVKLKGGSNSESPAWLGAQIHLPPTPVDRTIDLGEIHLAEPPLLVSGMVQTAAGAPLGGAMLELDIQGFYSRSMTAISAHNGSFEFRSFGAILLKEDSTGEVTVRAQHQHYLNANAKAPPGTKELLIEMVQAGEIAGSLETTPIEMSGVSSLLLKRQEGPRYAVGFSRPCKIDEGGSYLISKLAPGTYTLNAQLAVTGELVPIQADIEVQANATTQLAPIDLRSRFNLINLTVRAFDDRPGICLIRATSNNGWSSPQVDSAFDSVLVVGTTHASLDFSIQASGLMPRSIRGVQGVADVTLEQGLAFDFYLSAKTSRLDPGEILLLGIAEDNGSYRTTVSLSSDGENPGRATAYLPRFGSYTTRVSLFRAPLGRPALPAQEIAPARTLQFTSSVHEQALDISDEALSEARKLIDLSESL